MELALAIVFGALIGVLGTMIFLPNIADGALHVMKTNDLEYAAGGIEFYKGANQLMNQKVVILRVTTHD